MNSVTLGNGADIVNSDDDGVSFFELQVDNGVTVGSTAATSRITLFRAPTGLQSLDANTVTINDNGEIRLISSSGNALNAILEVDNGLLNVATGGTIVGMGLIQLTDTLAAPTTLMRVDGNLTAGYVTTGLIPIFIPASTLRITASDPNARLDLDGPSSNGVVSVNRNATLDIDVQIGDGAALDAFDGTMNLGDGATLDIQHDWILSNAEINVNTPGSIVGAGTAARITGGTMTMSLGTITLDTGGIDALRFDTVLNTTGGTIANSGHVFFDDDATIGAGTDFQMNGANASITVGTGATVTINDANFNLDGSGAISNIVTVESGGLLDLNLGAGADESFENVITLNSGRIDVNTASGTWTANRTLNLNNSTGTAPTVSGESLSLGSNLGTADADLNVTGAGLSLITAPVTFNSDADVNIAAGAILRTGVANFNSVNALVNASFTGTGTWQLAGTNTFSEVTTINMVGGTVDLDNSGNVVVLGGTDTFVNAPLTINAATLANYGKAFAGIVAELNVDNEGVETGSLTVNLDNPTSSWTLNSVGVLNLVNGAAVQKLLLIGAPVNVSGTVNVTGDVRTLARLINISGSVNINTAAEPLRLGGGDFGANLNTITGGTFSGAGLLGADSGKALRGHGTINTAVDFDGTAELRADNGTLTLNGAVTDVGTIGTADTDGVLNVVNAWNSNVATTVELLGGTLQGGTVTVDNANGIIGRGTVSSRVVNNTRITASAGTLIVETAANDNDWDGTLNAGQLWAVGGGTLEVRDNSEINFSGSVLATGGSTVFNSGSSKFDFESASSLQLSASTFRSIHSTALRGSITVNAGLNSTINVFPLARFYSTSSTTLNGNLQLDNTVTLIDSGAIFAGGGDLINMPGRKLQLLDGANVGVAIENRGTLEIGNIPAQGQAQGLDYTQTAAGSWDLEVGGLALNQFDRLTLTGAASLAGTLNLSLISGFQASIALGDSFNVLSAVGGVGGSFDTLIQPPTMPADLMFFPDYSVATLVRLVVVDRCDLNGDSRVDGADVGLLYANWGVVAAGNIADKDNSGTVDGADLARLFNAWTGDAAPNSVPEPSSGLLLVLASWIGMRVLRK
ncbi:MAG: hypothetical protein O2931_02975 [Planctomycetota bacterium]|nr:hypothetical protein [Planctomycetota bacterium]